MLERIASAAQALKESRECGKEAQGKERERVGKEEESDGHVTVVSRSCKFFSLLPPSFPRLTHTHTHTFPPVVL